MALKKYCRSKMVRPKEEEDTNYIYDKKTDDFMYYFDVSFYISRCAEIWYEDGTYDNPICMIDQGYVELIKKYNNIIRFNI